MASDLTPLSSSAEKSVTDKIRHVLDKTDTVERVVARYPVLNEFAEATRLTKLVAHFALDVCDGKDFREIRRDMAARGAEIIVDLLPTGSAATEALGIRKPMVEIVKRFAMAQNELLIGNPRGSLEALKTGEVGPYRENTVGAHITEGIKKIGKFTGTGSSKPQLALA